MAIHRLQDHNIPTVAFGLKKGDVAGVPIKTHLSDFQNIDTVTLYVGPDRQPNLYKGLLKLHPQRIIFNPGTENPEFQKILEDHGIKVEIACTLVLLATGQY